MSDVKRKELGGNKMTTVCKWCLHLRNLEPEGARADVWYNHLCAASPSPTDVDPYDGKKKPFTSNTLGQRYFHDNEFEYCRDVNDGHCQKFTALIAESE